MPAVDVDGPRVRLGLAWGAVSTVAVAAGAWPAALVFAGVALGAAGQAARSWRGGHRAGGSGGLRHERPGGAASAPGGSVGLQPERSGGAAAGAPGGGGLQEERPGGVAAGALGGGGLRQEGRRGPLLPVAAGGAVACALAGGLGPAAVLAAAVATVAAAGVGERLKPKTDGRTTLAIALTIGLAAASPALVRGQLGAVPALVLLLTVHVVDASAFIVGSGASNRWEGPVAGAAAAAALGLATAAAFVPPFRGPSPWVLAAVAAALAPLGTAAATAILGRGEAPVPALRRLDSWLLAGPVWALVARLVLDLR